MFFKSFLKNVYGQNLFTRMRNDKFYCSILLMKSSNFAVFILADNITVVFHFIQINTKQHWDFDCSNHKLTHIHLTATLNKNTP